MDNTTLEKKLKRLISPKLPGDFSSQVMTAIYEQKKLAKEGPVLIFQRAVNYISLGIFGVLCLFGTIQLVTGMYGSGISEYLGLMFFNFDVFVEHISLVLTAAFKAFPTLAFIKFILYISLFVVSIKMYKTLHSLKYIKFYG